MSDVIVGVDGSPQSLRAVEWAGKEAALRRHRLVIVHVLPSYEYDIPFFPPGRWAAAKADGDRIVAEAVAMARQCFASLQIDTRMPAARTLTALQQEAEHASVVVVGARGHGGFASLLLGSTSLQLAGHAACPVVVVREGTQAEHHEIVVGVDGSGSSAAAVGYAFAEAAAHGARVRAVHAWRLPAHPTEPPVQADPAADEVAGKAHEVLAEALAGWPDQYPNVEVVRTVAQGHPAKILIEASRGADLVVVGSRGRGGFHGLALGSVSHAMLHHGLCPVAVVRPTPP
jgi:nucleotide-binding universal stress UspA family protein